MRPAAAEHARRRRDPIVERALALLDAPPPLLVVSDFDGTLSPIVLDPGAAAMLPAARRALRVLAGIAVRRPDRVAVALLSGRTAPDVARLARVGGIRYLGSHGMETATLARRARASRLRPLDEPAFAAYEPVVTAVARDVVARLGDPDWLFLEPKGASIGLHYRRAADTAAARRDLVAALDEAERDLGVEGLVRLESRRVVELRPATAPGKGAAVARLTAELRPGAVLVMGDDRTDADAFRTVGAARARGDCAALIVGVRSLGETPAEVIESADVLVDSPMTAASLLATLAAAVRRETGLAGVSAAAPSPARDAEPRTAAAGSRASSAS